MSKFIDGVELPEEFRNKINELKEEEMIFYMKELPNELRTKTEIYSRIVG